MLCNECALLVCVLIVIRSLEGGLLLSWILILFLEGILMGVLWVLVFYTVLHLNGGVFFFVCFYVLT